tara:strand:+ start:2159 stop:2377 length:219 start_codon:yes stop_codon:yes gene_type:complete
VTFLPFGCKQEVVSWLASPSFLPALAVKLKVVIILLTGVRGNLMVALLGGGGVANAITVELLAGMGYRVFPK